MTLLQEIITITAVAAGTMLTRFLPFLIFPPHKKTPQFVKYLGGVLPYAVMGLLVVYCLKDVHILTYPFGTPEFISIIFIIGLHWWKRNMLFSIGAGTAIYMILVQFILK